MKYNYKPTKYNKTKFMIRLKKMINNPILNKNTVSLYCPGTENVNIPWQGIYPSNPQDRGWCEICKKVMNIDDKKNLNNHCPCYFYGLKEAIKIAQEKIKEWENEQ